MADPASIGYAIGQVATWFRVGFSGGGLTREQKRALDASGVRPIRGVFRTPDGRIVSREDAIAAGRVILAAQMPGAPLPAPTPLPRPPVTGGELFHFRLVHAQALPGRLGGK